jgi:hypothetical protein
MVLLGALGAAAWYGNRWYVHASAVDAAVAPLVGAYVGHGFLDSQRAMFSLRDRLEQHIDAGKCVVALASDTGGDNRLEVDRGLGAPALEGHGSIAWCTCRAEDVKVTALAPKYAGGVGLAQIDARLMGGALALPLLDPRPATIAEPEECAEEQLDAWLPSQPAVVAPEGWLETDPRTKRLRASPHAPGGAPLFSLVASVDPRLPFGVVAHGPSRCVLALSEDGDDLLSLRLAGDLRPIAKAKGPIAWCDPKGNLATVWREGKGRVYVLAASPDRLGGMLGLQDVMASAGLTDLTPWEAEADLGWDATTILQASGVSARDIRVSNESLHSQLVAFTMGSGTFAPDTADLSAYACAPPLGPTVRSALCMQASPLAWHPHGGVGSGAMAQGPVPFWMQIYNQVTDRDVLKAEVLLVSLTHRLAAQGFEATIDGVSELPAGSLGAKGPATFADVVGRAGDSAIVAVGMTAVPPWVLPYSEEGVAWALEGEPHFVSLTPGAHVKLACPTHAAVPPDARRTVVFRKAK